MTTEKVKIEYFLPGEVLHEGDKVYFLQMGGQKGYTGNIREMTADRLIVEMQMTNEEFTHAPKVNAPFQCSVNMPKETTLVDLSGSGASFVWTEPLEHGMEIEITIPDLPAIGELKTKAVVMRSIDRTALATPIFQIGAHFAVHLEKRRQNQLVRCIFLLQRKYLERGLGI